MKVEKNVWFCAPILSTGCVLDFGLAKMSRKTLNCGSLRRTGFLSVGSVEGTLRRPSESPVTAFESVDRYLRSSHASSSCSEPFGMPMIEPMTKPEPQRLGFETGRSEERRA